MSKLLLFIIGISLGFSLKAQLVLNGEFRPRTEFLHGYKAPMAKQREMFSLSTTQRTRLGLDYKGDKFKIGIQFQDVRAWGSVAQLVINDGIYTTIHQAWGEILFNENLSLKIGRQELIYDDHRIFGNVDWAQQARSHDLALLKYEKKEAYKFHFGVVVNQVQTRDYNVPGNYKSMQFAWFNKKFNNYNLSILALNNGVSDTTLNNLTSNPMTTYFQIIGQRSTYKKGNLSIGLNMYYQMGNDKSTYFDNNEKQNFHRTINAYNARIEVNYKINDKISAEIGYEILSGQSQTDTSTEYIRTNHAFNPAFGTNHKFNGWMDYFYVGNHLNTVGLNDLFLTIKYKKNKFEFGTTFHSFSAAAEILDNKEFLSSGKIMTMPSGLGMELDNWVTYKISNEVMFQIGISGMFDSESMRAIKGGTMGASNYWGWTQVVFKPTFL